MSQKAEAYNFSTKMRVEIYQEINSIMLKQSSLHSILFECMKVPLIKPLIYGKADLKPAVPYLVNASQIIGRYFSSKHLGQFILVLAFGERATVC